MSSSNCCFLTCIQISQVAGHVVWYSHLLKNFPQFVEVHTIKGFGIVNKTEVDIFLELYFSMIQWALAIWSLVPLPFLNPAWTSGNSWFMYCWSLAWRILSITLLACAAAAAQLHQSCPSLRVHRRQHSSVWDVCNCAVIGAFCGFAVLWDWNEKWPFTVLWPLLSFPNLLTYWVQHFHSIIF